jgi:hypothetical protein
VAIDGQWAVIGDEVEDFGGVPTGAAYPFRRTQSGRVEWACPATWAAAEGLI